MRMRGIYLSYIYSTAESIDELISPADCSDIVSSIFPLLKWVFHLSSSSLFPFSFFSSASLSLHILQLLSTFLILVLRQCLTVPVDLEIQQFLFWRYRFLQ